MNRLRNLLWVTVVAATVCAVLFLRDVVPARASSDEVSVRDRVTDIRALTMLDRGRKTFRFDTFGDQEFWGGTLQLHKAIEGAKFGGVGPGVSPSTALAVGLKVDSAALPQSLIAAIP